MEENGKHFISAVYSGLRGDPGDPGVTSPVNIRKGPLGHPGRMGLPGAPGLQGNGVLI